ncbi:MAG: tRNA epoxyqueuosine(34) reductase QueG [Sulfuricella sp.]|nr:tRNA epoxyqueuosine(34) reductase QueG [Sulfuricella sp.]
MDGHDYTRLAGDIKLWGRELGFAAVGIADTDLSVAEARLEAWLARGFHGDMDYMASHGVKRSRPAELIPGTLRVISLRMDYRPPAAHDALTVLGEGDKGYVSRYALGRDYHKVLRARLQKLAERIASVAGGGQYRVFTDSAPVMETELASKAGIVWRGKHSLTLTRDAGSWFFLGEIYTDLPLPADAPAAPHCGTCRRCMDACPTGAIVAPYVVDARRCISYLTIELKAAIPENLRPLLGNRIYGCDDCQLACPWNRAAPPTQEIDFAVRNGLDNMGLLELFAWSAQEFEEKLAGSPIRRIGFERWQRNLAVALGNAPTTPEIVAALRNALPNATPLVGEHITWALTHHIRSFYDGIKPV